MSVVQEVKGRLDIVDVIGEHITLRRAGNAYNAFCPFHSNTRTPAFVVFPDSQTWRCFGACADGGDVFTFLMKKEGWDFKETLTRLAERTGVELQAQTPAEQARQESADRLVKLLDAAADYFHQLLLHAPQAETTRTYLAQRDLTDATIADFRLGFALDSWDACRSHFLAQGYSAEDLLDAGLLSRNEERGTTYDRFRHRLMIPIADSGGQIVGFGARTLEKDGIPKYLNSPQGPLFDKSHLLYGLDRARRHIREAREAVIVEGYMDVLQAWQNGFHNVVAQMGTALTERQLGLLKRFTRRFIIALDSDAAGIKATMRSLEVARGTLDRDGDVRFDVRGLVRHEGRLQADIRVVTLPAGEDPDSLIRQDPAAWQTLVAEARPVVDHVVDLLTADLDMADAKGKTAVAAQVLPLIEDVANPVERDHYRQKLARRLQIDERALRRLAAAPRPAGPRSRPRPPEPESPPLDLDEAPPGADEPWSSARDLSRFVARNSKRREQYFLRQCLEYPTLAMKINGRLAQQALTAVAAADFTLTMDRALWPFLVARNEEANVATLSELCDSLPDPLQERIQRLLSVPPAGDSTLERLTDNLAVSVLDWRLEKARQQLGEMRQLVQVARQEQSEELLVLYQAQLRSIPLQISALNKARRAMSAMGRRLAEEQQGGRGR